MKVKNPMPTVTFEGETYKLRSRKTQIPDFGSMDRMSIRLWLLKNTTPKGYQKEPNPLIGLGGIVSLK